MSTSQILPLVVDLDGTLIKTDLLHETASAYLIAKPWGVGMVLWWLLRGKGELKAQLAEHAHVDLTAMPYHTELLEWLRIRKAQGQRLVLATASHQILADQVEEHLGIFDEVLGSTASANLKSDAKRAALVSHFGDKGFEYVGNDWADIPVWGSAAKAHVVSRNRGLIDAAGQSCPLGEVFSDGKPIFVKGLFKAMRPHQWMKNILVFVPLMAAHLFINRVSVLYALLAFLVFGLTASSVYLLNDLVDVANDRRHARKRLRPFASGTLSLLHGWLAWPILLGLGFALATVALSGSFVAAMAVYFGLTLAYSLWLKQIPMLDVLTLAALYTLRIIAGAAAIGVPLTFWLLSFSMFLFLSLAFIKRYSELKAARQNGQSQVLHGRGYSPHDLELVANLGGSAGYTSVLVLALYIQDAHTASLYARPHTIWLACPLLLFWISRAWLIAHRGQMHDDPIVFALKDRVSWVLGALFIGVFLAAKVIT
jgi:4-hydroxybenzoate polyprenyltransferase